MVAQSRGTMEELLFCDEWIRRKQPGRPLTGTYIRPESDRQQRFSLVVHSYYYLSPLSSSAPFVRKDQRREGHVQVSAQVSVRGKRPTSKDALVVWTRMDDAVVTVCRSVCNDPSGHSIIW